MTRRKNKRTQCIYEFIERYWATHERAPTVREIGRGCGLSVSTVSEHLSRLEAQGRITREALKSRTIRIVNGPPPVNESAERVWRFIQERQAATGITPSQDEIGAACFLSRTEVRRCLAWLEAQGRIRRGPGQRNIVLVED